MAKSKGTIDISKEMCKGCGVCIPACPHEVIVIGKSVNKKGYWYTIMENPDACTGCTNCATVCPDGVISVYRFKKEE